MKKLFAIVMVMLGLFVTACGNKAEEKQSEQDSSIPGTTAETEESTKETEENLQISEINPLQLDGYIPYESTGEEFELVGELLDGTKINGEYLSYMELHDGGDGWVVMFFATSNQSSNVGAITSTINVPQGHTRHVTSWNWKTKEQAPIVSFPDIVGVLQCDVINGKVWIRGGSEDYHFEAFSVDMKPLAKNVLAKAVYQASFLAGDGNAIYYETKSKELYRYDLNTNQTESVRLEDMFARSLKNSLVNEEGIEYIQMMDISGATDNGLEVVNMETGEIVFFGNPKGYFQVSQNVLCGQEWNSAGSPRWMVTKDWKTSQVYDWKKGATTNLFVTAERDYVFYYKMDQDLWITAFDGNTNECIGHGRLDISELTVDETYDYFAIRFFMPIGESSYAFSLRGPKNRYQFYRWTPEEKQVGTDFLAISEDDFPPSE